MSVITTRVALWLFMIPWIFSLSATEPLSLFNDFGPSHWRKGLLDVDRFHLIKALEAIRMFEFGLWMWMVNLWHQSVFQCAVSAFRWRWSKAVQTWMHCVFFQSEFLLNSFSTFQALTAMLMISGNYLQYPFRTPFTFCFNSFLISYSRCPAFFRSSISSFHFPTVKFSLSGVYITHRSQHYSVHSTSISSIRFFQVSIQSFS